MSLRGYQAQALAFSLAIGASLAHNPGMARTFLLDGTALAYRAHFAFTSRSGGLTTQDGHPTSATFGFTLTLRALLQKEKPDHIAVAFDGPIEKLERVAIYPEYKATREKAPEELVLQFQDCRDIVEAHGIPILELPGQEADDVIGTMALRCRDQGDEVFIMTGDKDFMQLIDDGQIRMFDIVTRGETSSRIIGPPEVVEKFGVQPEQIIDLLALMGDSSDNVPGVRGIGPKKAATLLQEYGTLDKVLEAAPGMKPSKQRDSLIQEKDMALLSRRLVTIRTDLDVPIRPEDLILSPPDPERLLALYTRLEFHRFIDEIKKELQAKGKGGDDLRVDYKIVESLEECKALARRLASAEDFSFDTETTGLDVGTLDVVGLSFATKAGKAWYVPLLGPDLPEGHDRDAWLAPFVPLLEDQAPKMIGQNAKYDIHAMQRAGVTVRNLGFDTMLASYCIDPGSRHGLDPLCIQYFDYRKIPTSEIIGTGRKMVTMAEVEHEKVGHYAAEDADFTYRLRAALEPELEARGVNDIFWDLEMPLVPVLVDMESRGIRVDSDAMEALSLQMGQRLEVLKENIHGHAGREFNINSPAQLGEVLFDELELHKKLSLRAPKKTKTGQYKTDAAVLESLGAHPIGAELLEYRRLSKLKGTYVDVLPTMIRESTGRIHTSYNQVAAATGRLSSDNPNLQNIPIRTEEGRLIRDCFIPGEEGWVIISSDYSQVELRILAHFSKDETLVTAFQANEDIHRKTAALIHGIMPELVTSEMRSHAKVINYGLVYGMGATRLAGETGLTRKQAQDFIDRYFQALPGVKHWLDETLAKAQEDLEVRTLFGRVRPLPDIEAQAPMIRAQAENKAVNSPIQGTAADIIKKAMIDLHARLEDEGLQARMLLQVHDELVLECPESEVEQVSQLTREAMEGAADLLVPLIVDIGIGKTWLEAHS